MFYTGSISHPEVHQQFYGFAAAHLSVMSPSYGIIITGKQVLCCWTFQGQKGKDAMTLQQQHPLSVLIMLDRSLQTKWVGGYILYLTCKQLHSHDS